MPKNVGPAQVRHNVSGGEVEFRKFRFCLTYPSPGPIAA
jgi:hypothetical protein